MSADSVRDPPRYRALAARGELIYARFCRECHGADGRGDGPSGFLLRPRPTNFRDVEYMEAQRPNWYYDAVRRGVAGTGMSRWDHRLAPEDLWDVTFYVWSLSDTPDRLATGRQVYRAHCEECHGRSGNADRSAALADPSRVANSREDVARQILQQHASNDVDFTKEELTAVVAYVWTLLYDPLSMPVDNAP